MMLIYPIAALTLSFSLVTQQAKPPAKPFEPYSGQPGKDVVWVPTPPELVEKMLDMAKVTPQDVVMDLGSGDGRNIIGAAKRGARAIGVEYNPDMVELSRRLAKEAGVADKATFVQGDMYEADISKASVMALFLLTTNLDKLKDKFLALKPGTRIVLNTFAVTGWAADESETVGGECSDVVHGDALHRPGERRRHVEDAAGPADAAPGVPDAVGRARRRHVGHARAEREDARRSDHDDDRRHDVHGPRHRRSHGRLGGQRPEVDRDEDQVKTARYAVRGTRYTGTAWALRAIQPLARPSGRAHDQASPRVSWSTARPEGRAIERMARSAHLVPAYCVPAYLRTDWGLMLRVGAHMSVAGGVSLAIDRAVLHGCEALQIFAKNANRWRARAARPGGDPALPPPPRRDGHPPGGLARQLSDQPRDGRPALRRMSIEAFVDELDRAHALGLLGVVLHPGTCTSGTRR